MKWLVIIAALVAAWAVFGPRAIDKLSAEHKKYVEQLHPSAQDIFARFIVAAEATGWQVIITSGYRSFQTQARLKAENSKNASAGYSWHNYGMALDINLEKDGQRVRMASSSDAWERTGVPQIGKRLGLRWGGEFANYHDPVHFDISEKIKAKGLSIADLAEKAKKQFGSIESAQGNRVIL